MERLVARAGDARVAYPEQVAALVADYLAERMAVPPRGA